MSKSKNELNEPYEHISYTVPDVDPRSLLFRSNTSMDQFPLPPQLELNSLQYAVEKVVSSVSNLLSNFTHRRHMIKLLSFEVLKFVFCGEG